MRAEVEHDLTTEVEGNSDFFRQFNDDRGSALRQLLLDFCRDMATHHQISFIGSRAIWESILDFLESRELPKKQLAHPDRYFAIAQPALDRYVAQQIGGLLSSRQATGFAILWGIPYLYEFLQSRQIITEQTSQQAIAGPSSRHGNLPNPVSRPSKQSVICPTQSRLQNRSNPTKRRSEKGLANLTYGVSIF